MSLIIPANSAAASGSYAVDNSCRFDGASSVMHVDTSSASTNKVTISAWIKRSKITADGFIITSYRDNSNRAKFGFGGADNLTYFMTEGGTDTEWNTTAKFRDTGAWYHVVAQLDNTQSTFANRCKLFVNGTEYATSSSGSSTQNSATAIIGNGTTSVGNSYYGGAYQGNWFGGYMAQVAMIQGVIHAPTDFGEFDEDSGIWKPIDITGLTYASYSFLLDFEDSGNLGNNASGSGLADLTEAGLAATDQSTDTCTNNFATMNSLDNFFASSTFSEGNLKIATVSGNAAYNPSNFAVKTGKWYWEVKLVACSAGDNSEATIFGISNQSPVNAGYDGSIQIGDGFGLRGNGNIWSSSGTVYGWNTVAVGNIVSVAVDFDNGKFYTATNGTYGNSSNPSTASNGYSFTVGTDVWFMGVNQRETSQTATFEVNFGSPPYSESGGETDGDGFGNFAYEVPSGYFALCTKNLAEYG